GQWLRHDVLALAGPGHADRLLLYDFIVEELRARVAACPHRLGPLYRALKERRDALLAFAGGVGGERGRAAAALGGGAGGARGGGRRGGGRRRRRRGTNSADGTSRHAGRSMP